MILRHSKLFEGYVVYLGEDHIWASNGRPPSRRGGKIKGKVLTERELVLEQTQQGTSYKVSVSTDRVEELKRKVKIKGEKKEALLTLRQKPEKFDTSAGNPVKEILLKLNLPDHRILKDGGEVQKVTSTQDDKDYKMAKRDYAWNYHQLLPIIAEKAHQEKVQQDKLKAVKARLNFKEASQYFESGAPRRKRKLKEMLRSRCARSISGSPEPRHGHSESPRKRGPERRTMFKILENGVFHGLRDKGKGHTIDECMHLKRQIEEMLKARKLSHLIKELKQSSRKDHAKATKKGEISGKDKPLAILMVQPWQRVAKQKITQTFSAESTISFPPLGEEDGMEGPMIIEAEMGGHFVHRMYVDRGSSLKILYEHCFNRFRPEVRSQMILATTPLVEFSREIIWPLWKISLLVKIGETVTLRSSRIIPLECTMVLGPGMPQKTIDQVAEEKIQVAIHPEYPKQTVAIGFTLTEVGRKEKYTKKSDFQWTMEAEIAFKQMKKLIAKLPMLTAPKEKEELIMYQTVAKEAISAVLMTERDRKQMPIYFVSRALQAPEVNYTSMEKLILTHGYCSSCMDDFEAGLIITNLKGMKFTYALRENSSRRKEEVKSHMSQGSNGETPFSLTYRAEAVILVEIGMPTLRTAEVDMIKNDEALGVNLDLLEEKSKEAAIREARSKAKMEKYYNARVRSTSFHPGDLVYQNNETSRTKDRGKLGPKWEGPYEVTEALEKGAYKLRDHNRNTLPLT
uniref:Reverse transcriptase domain-containing protein n=1 Tax=Tanacetum cinerariifolium TaxID=118510 RepID=A0A6L2LES0_TANCI|nr:reverse transcriptase domain-containing protein [Tanacetum cinerariifolium]